jgi:hypothetical protein
MESEGQCHLVGDAAAVEHDRSDGAQHAIANELAALHRRIAELIAVENLTRRFENACYSGDDLDSDAVEGEDEHILVGDTAANSKRLPLDEPPTVRVSDTINDVHNICIVSDASVANECDRPRVLSPENMRFRRALPELPSVNRPIEPAAETYRRGRGRFTSPVGETSHGDLILHNDPRLPSARYSAIRSSRGLLADRTRSDSRMATMQVSGPTVNSAMRGEVSGRECIISAPGVCTGESLSRSRRDAVSGGNRFLPTIKLDKFCGDTPIRTHLAKFENCAFYYSWSSRDRLCHLKASLDGPAAQVLWENPNVSSEPELNRNWYVCCVIDSITIIKPNAFERNCDHGADAKVNQLNRYIKTCDY